MQEQILKLLRCPVCKEKLSLRTIQSNKKRFETLDKEVIETGVLSCSCGFLFPILDCVPRMLTESFLDHENFLQQTIPDFINIKEELLKKHGDLIHASQKRNKQTKASFSLEWNLLNG